MLTRLKVSGFKNLVDVDVRFGPFTCIAGPNDVGKSNLFDAICFLSALADRPLLDAASTIRRNEEETKKTVDIRSLFHRHGGRSASKMSFEAEMIVPSQGLDDLSQEAKATNTFLRYTLDLAYRKDENVGSLDSLEVLKEELDYFKVTDARKELLFPHTSDWRKSAISGERKGTQFISTEGKGEDRIVRLHQDGGSRGRPLWQVKKLNRTVLSTTNTSESPTVLLARREMQSWRLLQLEPSALRRPDEFSAPTRLASNGSHLASTLYRLAHHNGRSEIRSDTDTSVYARVANRLAQLIDDVYRVTIDRDEMRELLSINLVGRDRTPHAARSLSDGTLRFLALAVLEQDPEVQGILCLEEPENGIHPARIPAMIRLLQDIASDTSEPIGDDNPLRQIIINTHAPAVVQQVPEDALLIAEPKEMIHSGQRFSGVRFSCLPGTWRTKSGETSVCKMGDLLSYLNPIVRRPTPSDENSATTASPSRQKSRQSRRVIDHPEVQPYFPGWEPV